MGERLRSTALFKKEVPGAILDGRMPARNPGPQGMGKRSVSQYRGVFAENRKRTRPQISRPRISELRRVRGVAVNFGRVEDALTTWRRAQRAFQQAEDEDVVERLTLKIEKQLLQ